MSSTNVDSSSYFWRSNYKIVEDQIAAERKEPLREKNNTRTQKHVPPKEKPLQVVARRNARERKRVHAVNCAFVRLRKAIPVQSSKRISKLKTLQHAIQYIQALDKMLRNNSQTFLDNFLNNYQGYSPMETKMEYLEDTY